MSDHKTHLWNIVIVIVILLLTCLAYKPTLKSNFVNWDDDFNVTNNMDIKGLDMTHLKKMFKNIYLGMYQPITTLSFADNYKTSGLKPGAYHLTNLIIHLLNILLVFYVMMGLVKKRGTAILVTVLFALHPLHTESVSWVSERKDVLYTLFYLLAMFSYMKAINVKKGKALYHILTFVFFAFSLLSKSAAISLPLVLLLIDYYNGASFNFRGLLNKTHYFLLAAFFIVISLMSQYSPGVIQGTDIYSLHNYSLIERPFLITYSISLYLIKFLIPAWQSALYPYPVKTGSFLPINYYLSFVFIFGLIWVILFALKRSGKELRKDIVFGLLFFVITSILFLQFIPLPGHAIAAERYTYLPYIGLSIIIGQLYCKIKWNENRYITTVFLIAVAVLFSFLTFQRNKVWKNSITLFSDVISKHPDAALAYCNRGLALHGEGQYEKAISDYKEAIKYYPKFTQVYFNRGNSLISLGDYSGAIRDYDYALQLKPGDAEVYINRGIAKYNLKEYMDAINDYSQGIMYNPGYPEAYLNRGVARYSLTDFNGALSDFNYALKLNPNFIPAYRNRGYARYQLKDISGACGDWQKAIQAGDQTLASAIAEKCK